MTTKLLLILALLAGQGCAVVAGGVAVVRASQATNHIFGGEDCSTLTQAAYESKQRGETRGKIEDGIYTAMFLPLDIPTALVSGKPENIGSHGATWMGVKDVLPTICKVNPEGYGGVNYKAMMSGPNEH